MGFRERFEDAVTTGNYVKVLSIGASACDKVDLRSASAAIGGSVSGTNRAAEAEDMHQDIRQLADEMRYLFYPRPEIVRVIAERKGLHANTVRRVLKAYWGRAGEDI